MCVCARAEKYKKTQENENKIEINIQNQTKKQEEEKKGNEPLCISKGVHSKYAKEYKNKEQLTNKKRAKSLLQSISLPLSILCLFAWSVLFTPETSLHYTAMHRTCFFFPVLFLPSRAKVHQQQCRDEKVKMKKKNKANNVNTVAVENKAKLPFQSCKIPFFNLNNLKETSFKVSWPETINTALCTAKKSSNPAVCKRPGCKISFALYYEILFNITP